MKKISVLIPDGEDDRSLIVVRSLAYSRKVKVHVLSPKNRNVFLSRHCITHELVADPDKNNARFERVKEIAAKYSIDVLLPIGEAGIQFVHQFREFLDEMFLIPPIPDSDALKTVSDKWLLNEFLRKNTYPFVNSVPYKDRINGELQGISFPVLLKPRTGAGGIGIRYIESRETLSDTMDIFENPVMKNGCILQEYMKGTSIDMSVLCVNGEILAYTMQKPLHTSKNSFTFSRIIKLINNHKLYSVGRKILSSLNWSGVAHLDFIYNEEKDQFYLIDFNPRYWGTLTGSVIAGVNFPQLACQLAMGKSIQRPEYRETKYAIIKQKDLFQWLFGRKGFEGIPITSTNLIPVLKDPLPALNIYHR